MTNILVQPLEISHDRLDPLIVEVIRTIDGITHLNGVRYFLAGATARELLLRNVFGRPAGRKTLDVDFGIALKDWDEFEALKAAMLGTGLFSPSKSIVHRLTYNRGQSLLVDLIPFGGIEGKDGTVAWPNEDTVLKVAGFSDALESAVMVRISHDLVIPVVCIPALMILKLFAWMDRKHEQRDVSDIYTILKEYGDAGNEDRLYGEQLSVLEGEGYDVQIAGALLLGTDAARIATADTAKQVSEILQSDKRIDELTRDVIRTSNRSDLENGQRCEALLRKFRDGFMQPRQ